MPTDPTGSHPTDATRPESADTAGKPSVIVDHLAIWATSLDVGVPWFEALTGVTLTQGGEHARLSTHNRIAAFNPCCYLELISINPAAPAPERPRWFGLDQPAVKQRLQQGPQLLTWVISTSDIDATVAAARYAGVDPGSPVPMSRGDLHWQVAFPADGSLPEAGTFPLIIQWQDQQGAHPAASMQRLPLAFERLDIFHPEPAFLAQALDAIGASQLALLHLHEEPAPHALQATLTRSDAGDSSDAHASLSDIDHTIRL